MAIIVVGIIAVVIFVSLGVYFNRVDHVMKQVINRINDSYVNTDQAHTMLTTLNDDYSSYWDSAFLFVFGAFWIAGLLIGYYKDYGRFVLILMILVLVGLLFAAGKMSDYWASAGADDGMAGRTLYPYTYFILDNLMWVILVIVGSSVLVNFIKDG